MDVGKVRSMSVTSDWCEMFKQQATMNTVKCKSLAIDLFSGTLQTHVWYINVGALNTYSAQVFV